MSNPETMISLQSYAAVLAGLGAGLSLRRALAQAEVPAPAWEPASEHWQAQIDESAASDLGLLVAFDCALSTARRRFEPTIEPIASDPQAWAQFRRHFVTAVDPVAFLAERDLSLGAYARLEADWANRLLADAALAATIQRHMDTALSECPALTVTLSPWLRDADAAQPEAPGPREAAPALQQPVLAPPPAVPPPTPAGAPWLSPAQQLGTTHVEWDPTVTAPMPALRAVGASAVLPFIEAAPPPGPLPELSVEQYAWVVAKLRKATSADFAATLATLRLTPETREQLEAHWRARMGRDPALQQAFIAALGRLMKGKRA